MPNPVIIEAAINGGTPKSRNPNSPRTPAEIAERLKTLPAWRLENGVIARDYPLITGTVIVYTLAFVTINFTIDILYALVDPEDWLPRA